MKYQIKRTSLTFKEEILPAVYDSKDEAKLYCSAMNRARDEMHTVIEVAEEVPESTIVVKVEKNGKINLVSDIRTYPGAKDWKLTNNMEFAKKSKTTKEASEVAKLYQVQGFTTSFIELKRATFDSI